MPDAWATFSSFHRVSRIFPVATNLSSDCVHYLAAKRHVVRASAGIAAAPAGWGVGARDALNLCRDGVRAGAWGGGAGGVPSSSTQSFRMGIAFRGGSAVAKCPPHTPAAGARRVGDIRSARRRTTTFLPFKAISFLSGVVREGPVYRGQPPENPVCISLREEWLGPESNRRHEDFQSSALPTELPSHDRGRRGACTRRLRWQAEKCGSS